MSYMIRQKKGMALAIVITLMVLVSIGFATMLQAALGHANAKSRMIDEIRSRYLAEAGTQYALAYFTAYRASAAAVFDQGGVMLPQTRPQQYYSSAGARSASGDLLFLPNINNVIINEQAVVVTASSPDAATKLNTITGTANYKDY